MFFVLSKTAGFFALPCVFFGFSTLISDLIIAAAGCFTRLRRRSWGWFSSLMNCPYVEWKQQFTGRARDLKKKFPFPVNAGLLVFVTRGRPMRALDSVHPPGCCGEQGEGRPGVGSTTCAGK